MKNRYRSLNGGLIFLSSVTTFRLLALFIGTIGISLAISMVSSEEGLSSSLILMIFISVFIYFLSKFSSILYNSSEIVVQNISRKKVFGKIDFSLIKPWQPYINIYTIEFKDGQSFLFTTGQLFIGVDSVKEANELRQELFDEWNN